MKPDNRTDKRKLGDIGETVSCEFLRRRGFEIVDRNYLRKWGEIDIIAKKAGIFRFVEVKSVSRENIDHVAHVTLRHAQGKPRDDFRPEENVHPAKLKRLHRAIQTYMLEKNLDCDWQLDVAIVYINLKTRQARVEIIENVII